MSIASPPRVKATRPSISAEAARRQLDEQLRVTRDRAIRQRMASGACRLMIGAAFALAMMAIADYWLELATAWRALWLVAVVAGTIAAAVVGWRRRISSYTLTHTAREAEARAAQFGQRLRTTLDYEDELPEHRPARASVGLLEAMHTETYEVAQKADWDAMVDGRPLIRAVLLGACLAMVWFIALVLTPEFRTATARTLLLPLQYTTVTYTPETSTIRCGEGVTIEAEVAGRPIPSAQLRYRTKDSVEQEEWATVDLLPPDADEESAESDSSAPVKLHGPLSAKLLDLHHDLEFEVLVGPLPLPPGSIRVLQPLNLTKPSARILPPEYTGRKEETVSELDLKVLEGSTVELSLELSRAAAEGLLSQKSVEDKSPPVPFTIDGNHLRATLTDLRKSVTFSITAKAADGIELKPLELNIKVKLDKPPGIQFIAPPEELSVTATTDVPMIVEAGDDLGLHKVGILYQIGSEEPKTLWEDDAGGTTEPFQGDAVLMLEDEKVTYQDAVTYYAFAEDNYFGEPRRVTTPLRFIDIRPFKQSFQLGEQGGGGGGGASNGNSVTLEEIIHRQRQQLAQAFAAKQQSSPPAELIASLAEGENELREKTDEFIAGLIEIVGPIPTLDEAATRMETAVDALNEQQLADGVTAEQQALAALIKARENVRKKINQSECKSQCQKFDREQKQKLRLPEKKKQDEEQKQAEARKKLNDLAKREREWSQKACSACQNPSSSSQSGKPSQSSSSQSSSSQSSSSQSSSSSPSSQPMPMGEPMPMQTAAEKQAERDAAAKDQQEMLKELEDLKKQIAQLGKKPSEAAQQQAEQAGKSMEKGLEELQKQNGDEAAKAGERSADELEQLAAHLAAMNAKDVGQRLEQVQQLAQQLAAGEEKVEKKLDGEKKEGEGKDGEKGSKGEASREASAPGDLNKEDVAAEQKNLATQGKMLQEQLDALQRDAAKEAGGVGQKLSDLIKENPPAEIAAGMQKAADDLKKGERKEAGKGVTQSREKLQELGKSLGDARNQYAQPQLQELMKLEEQLAQLRERTKQAGNKPDGATEEKWQQLAQKLGGLAEGDKKLAEAMKRLKASQFQKNGQVMPEGYYPEMELLDAPSLNEVAKALQTKIQEAILAAALMDADQPVPPQYKELVEKYYRALSDDLR
jgi:hypothetical protein